MNVFQSDIKERAAMARGARARVGGSKSKKVTLSTDNMTDAEISKLHGPVVTYRMVPDVPDEELAKWPDDLRAMYREKFGR